MQVKSRGIVSYLCLGVAAFLLTACASSSAKFIPYDPEQARAEADTYCKRGGYVPGTEDYFLCYRHATRGVLSIEQQLIRENERRRVQAAENREFARRLIAGLKEAGDTLSRAERIRPDHPQIQRPLVCTKENNVYNQYRCR